MSNERIPVARGLRTAVCSVLLVSMTACTSMAPVAGPREFIPAYEPSIIWVKKTDGMQTFAMEGPRVIGDTIVGFVEGEYLELPIVDVQSVRARQFSRGKTTAFLIGAGALAVGLSFVLSGGHGGYDEQTGEDDIGFRLLRIRF